MLIVDDETLVRHALRLFVDSAEDLTVVGEARDGSEAISMSAALKPEVILMDIQMPGMNGIDATAHIMEAQQDMKVLAVTTFSSEKHVVSALRAGASGYLVKDTSPEEILESIRRVHDGKAVLSQRISRQLIKAVRESEDRLERLTQHVNNESAALTSREHSIIQLLAEGLSNAEMGARLHLAEATVKANLRRITQKWGVRDRVQVLIRAAREGIVSF